MKRISVIIILALMLLVGCGKKSDSILKIEEYKWTMFSVQSKEDGMAIAYGERGSSTLDTAKQLELTCIAENGSLSIADKTNNKSYSGIYTHKETFTESVIYEVEIDGMEGMAVVSMTSYQNGEEEPTFIISLEEYSINFYSE